MTLQHVNRMGQVRFVETLGAVFEHSAWVAEGAWHDRPFASVEELHRRMVAEVAGASREQHLALLRAHPDLGTGARMSASSQTEQSGAGVNSLTEAEQESLASYRERFGFPFIFAVKGAEKAAIFEALERRLARDAEAEFREAMEQVYRIAWFRLEESIA